MKNMNIIKEKPMRKSIYRHNPKGLEIDLGQGRTENILRSLNRRFFMGRLIIDDTTIYEIDEECMRQKEQKEKRAKPADIKEQSLEGRGHRFNKVKERPAP